MLGRTSSDGTVHTALLQESTCNLVEFRLAWKKAKQRTPQAPPVPSAK